MPAYSRILLPWDSQPQEVAEVAPEYLQYDPKIVLLPAAFYKNLGRGSNSPSAANDVTVRAGSFRFPGVNGYIDLGSDTNTPIGSYTILAVSRLDSFPSAYPALVSFTTTSTKQICFYSNDANYLDLCVGSFSALSSEAARFSLSGTGPVLGTRRNLVVRRSSASALTSSFTAWANGTALTRSSPGAGFGADPGGNSAIGQNSSTSTTNDFVGDLWLFALFNKALPDQVCQELSANPWQLFAPQSIWVPVNTGGGGTTYTISPTGGITFAGNGIEVNGKILSVSGGVIFSGSGSITFNSGGTTYIITPTGGITFAGGSSVNKAKVFLPTGGISFAGTGLSSRGKIVAPNGGVIFSGSGNMTSNTSPGPVQTGERTKVGVGT